MGHHILEDLTYKMVTVNPPKKVVNRWVIVNNQKYMYTMDYHGNPQFLFLGVMTHSFRA